MYVPRVVAVRTLVTVEKVNARTAGKDESNVADV
jgi:hypothetical protein